LRGNKENVIDQKVTDLIYLLLEILGTCPRMTQVGNGSARWKDLIDFKPKIRSELKKRPPKASYIFNKGILKLLL